MEEVDEDKFPLILGRPFLATAGALIDVQKGKIRLRVNVEEIVFSLEKAMRWPSENEDCKSIEVVEEIIEECLPFILSKDPLETCISASLTLPTTELDDLDDMSNELASEFLESLLALNENRDSKKDVARVEEAKWKRPYLPLEPEGAEPVEKKKELKPLPDHLMYAYLGENETFPVIVSSSLSLDEESDVA